jgi:hypothetical protein
MRILRPRSKPKKAYPNSDRFGEDGRRIYSAYAPAQGKKPAKRGKRRLVGLLGGVSVAAVVGVLMYLVGSG